jgi:hypothetical protein
MEENVKWEDFVKKNKISIKQLPESVQHKIEVFNDTFDEYEEEDDENETSLRDLEARLMALDNGILSDLESFVAKRKEQTPPKAQNGGQPINAGQVTPTPQAGDGGQTPPTPPQHQTSDKPSWAFWM